MEIILLKDIEKLGGKHEIVSVKNGYGRNYLIPQGLAIIANSSNRRRLNELKRIESAQIQRELDDMKLIAAKLENVVLKINAKAGTSGKIFGSVNNLQLSQALKDQFEVEIDRSKIEILEEVKMLGSYVADVKLHPEVDLKVNFEVVQD